MQRSNVENCLSQPTRILRIRDVMLRTALSRSQIYRLIDRGEFPQQIRLGERAAGWIEEEVARWLQSRIELSRKARVA